MRPTGPLFKVLSALLDDALIVSKAVTKQCPDFRRGFSLRLDRLGSTFVTAYIVAGTEERFC